MARPESITKVEFCAKIQQLQSVLEKNDATAIYLCSEGAMRWLTGKRHQVVDIHPGSATTVQAVIDMETDPISIVFYSDPWEAARVHDLIASGPWNDCGIKAAYGGTDADLSGGKTVSPAWETYGEIERAIVSPLVEGLEGNQGKKLSWLVSNSRQALIDIAKEITIGMTGWDLRSLVYRTYHERHIELNLVMLGLSGMTRHLHPVIEDDSIVEPAAVIKIAIGARYYDMFHSATQLVKIDEDPTERELTIHRALQEATLAYADRYRSGAVERDIHRSLGPIFTETARTYHLEGFEQSAYLHHAGGPLSPLGNRDFVLTAQGTRPMLPMAQFSVNPVDALAYLKFELQGIVRPAGAPMILDEFSWCTGKEEQNLFDETVGSDGEKLRLPTIIRNGEN